MAAGRRRVKKQRRSRGSGGARKRRAAPRAMTAGRRFVLQIDIRPELKRWLHARAVTAGMTLQAYVLSIMRNAGVPVRPDDLLDRRKHENRKTKPMPAAAKRPLRRSAAALPAARPQPASSALLRRLGLEGIDGVGPCIIVVNVDGGRLKKNSRKRVAKAKPRRQLARRRKSK